MERKQLLRRDEIIKMVSDELERCEGLHDPFHSSHEGYAVILEELDELWDEIKSSKLKTINRAAVKEAIQVAAMAVKLIESLFTKEM